MQTISNLVMNTYIVGLIKEELKMAKWDYDLKEMGSNLRDYINEGDASKKHCEAILGQIIICCKYLMDNITKEDKDWYEMDLEELIQDCEDTKCYLDEYDYESNEENVDDILETFYDLMDSMRVWVAM